MTYVERRIREMRDDLSEVIHWHKQGNPDLARLNLRHICDTAGILISEITEEEIFREKEKE